MARFGGPFSLWSSQDLVETFALLLEVGLKIIRADAR